MFCKCFFGVDKIASHVEDETASIAAEKYSYVGYMFEMFTFEVIHKLVV